MLIFIYLQKSKMNTYEKNYQHKKNFIYWLLGGLILIIQKKGFKLNPFFIIEKQLQ